MLPTTDTTLFASGYQLRLVLLLLLLLLFRCSNICYFFLFKKKKKKKGVEGGRVSGVVSGASGGFIVRSQESMIVQVRRLPPSPPVRPSARLPVPLSPSPGVMLFLSFNQGLPSLPSFPFLPHLFVHSLLSFHFIFYYFKKRGLFLPWCSFGLGLFFFFRNNQLINIISCFCFCFYFCSSCCNRY